MAMLLFLVVFFLAVPVASADTIHIVQPGENLFRIALKYGLSTNELAAYNGIVNPDHVYAGQVLNIPDGEDDQAAQEIATSEPEAEPSAPETDTSDPELEPSESSPVTHLVQRGEILSQIALDYGVSVQSIAQANGIANPSLLYAGLTLVIPNPSNMPAEEVPIQAPEANVSHGDRWIDVNLSTQRLTAYEETVPVFTTIISSGRYPYNTVTGEFQIYLRYRLQDMNGYNLGYDYYLPDVPYVQYFYSGFALHGTYWHNNFGTPMSHGCVNLTISDAQWLYNWSTYGTVVSVHY